MKRLAEDENEGLLALLGDRVTIFTSGYFYTGTLVGVNDFCVKLKDPKIIYETGSFDDKQYKDVQSLNVDYWYITTNSIESFGVLK